MPSGQACELDLMLTFLELLTPCTLTNQVQYKKNKFILIQGDSGGICTTLGNDSMSDSKQKSSYEHGSNFERLRSYGHFLIPGHALV